MQMVEAGVLGPEDKVELIGGIITDMSPSGSRHNHLVAQLNRMFSALWSEFELRVQGTLELSEGQVFDPDFMLARKKSDAYKHKLPTAGDVLLVVEVSESSLQHDLNVKLPFYAEAGISEYWIVDLQKQVILVHRQPEGSKYLSVETVEKSGSVSPLSAPEFSLQLTQLFD